MTHWARPELEGEIVDDNRTCWFRAKFSVSKYDDGDKDPRYRLVTQAKFNEIEWTTHEVTVFDSDGEEIGKCAGDSVPEAEAKFWDKKIEARIKRELEDHINDYNWSEER